MKALHRVFVMMLMLSVLTYGQGNTFEKIRYNGGTVQTKTNSEEDRKFIPVGVETVTAKKEEEGKKPEAAAVASTEQATGAVKVTSQPEGADIWVDDAFVGNAPAQLKLTPGKHRIRVGKEGFKNWEKEISVTAGSELTINAPLKN